MAIRRHQVIRNRDRRSSRSNIYQIPSDLVVKYQDIDIIHVMRSRPGERSLSKHHVDTRNRSMSRSHHRRPTNLPLKAMECGLFVPMDTTCDLLQTAIN
jgi:hypothetical protein